MSRPVQLSLSPLKILETSEKAICLASLSVRYASSLDHLLKSLYNCNYNPFLKLDVSSESTLQHPGLLGWPQTGTL